MGEAVAWSEVLACFSDRPNPLGVIQRLGAEWARRYRLPAPSFGPEMAVSRETWGHERVGRHLDTLAVMVPDLITTQRPRRMDGPLVLVDFGDGLVGQIDGRRRANVWRHRPGEYQVLRIHAA